MTTINPMGALTKELKFEQKRGVTLGRPELQKVFDGGRNSGGHVSPNTSRKNKKDDDNSELGKVLQKQTQKIDAHKREEEEEAAKPEFMRFKLKKTASSS